MNKPLSLLALLLALLPAAARAAEHPPPARPLRLALTSTSALGVTHAGFFNQLVGARLDYRFTPRFTLGAALSYANLEGRAERAHNALPEARLEYALPVSGDDFSLPFHFTAGYLPKNGPTLRLGAGVAIGLGESASIELIPLEPMIWVVRERPEVSLDASLALRFAF